ncbi:uncharacterized protein LOC120777930 [Bactrocera tryoni]|uniref:uncharacterized protein LOC120777930 n=1 Tax=Bactrocera tryoni TaxID=59916 RepID=UPI001A974631|nr:uncharacterized protein LOC120777930 [Bactrocera tryoni]
MQSFNNLTTLLNLIGVTTLGQEFMQILADIVINSSKERRVNTIIYTSYEAGNNTALDSMNILRSLAQNTRGTVTFLHIDTTPPIERYFKKFNTELLSIAQLTHNRKLDESILRKLWQRLWRIRQTRLILLLHDLASSGYVSKILRLCLRHQVFNVIVLQPHKVVMEGSYWTVRIYPTQMPVKSSFTPPDYRAIFPKHLSNMYGHPLRVFTKAWYPQIYTYTPTAGDATLSGFLGRALVEYANFHNATIEHPIGTQRKYLSYVELCDYFENKTIDMGSLEPIDFSDRNISFSVVFQRIDWCLMVPLEQPLPKSSFYFNIIQSTVLILFSCSFIVISCFWICIARWQAQPPLKMFEHFINIPLLPGLLGMAFQIDRRISSKHKLLVCTISLAGVIVGTAYGTYLQSYIVNAPLGARVQTITELLRRGIQVAVSAEELEIISNNLDFRKYLQNFTVFNNFTELLLLRDTLDTGYAFTVTDMWAIYDELQKYFARPLFRLSDICFYRNYPMVIPLQESSMHRQPLNEFLARLHEAGLIDHWRRHSFLELLEMDWLTLYDNGTYYDFKPMQMADLHEVLAAMSVLFVLSLISFVFEFFEVTIFRFYTSVRHIIRKSLITKK